MEEREFLRYAEAELARLEAALEQLQAEGRVDFDLEVKPGGILELDFGRGGKIVIHRHLAAREIWLAARSGGYHFRPPSAPSEPWRDTKSGADLGAVLSRCIEEQTGQTVTLTALRQA
ncbi:MAG: iron donor protein CyaY [Rhodocyclaceae bacterium]|nr:iron donor protein CyaY [Rhodocyclaceae bacterium]